MDIKLVGDIDNGLQQSIRGSYANGIGGGNQRSGFRNNNQQNGIRDGTNRSRGDRRQEDGIYGSGKKQNLTVEELDADLDAYRAEGVLKK